jgi:hypothetical protein
MRRRAWLSFVLIIAAVAAVFVIVWAIWGQDIATAAATIAAIPIAVVTLAAPQIFSKPKLSASPVMIVTGNDESDNPGFRYESRNENGQLAITPRDPYLDLLRSGGRITPLSAFQSPWRSTFKWPVLDIKIVNNSDRTLILHEIILDVNDSRLDTRPVPIIRGIGDNMRVPLFNVGWGPMIDTTIRFQLAPGEDADPVTPELILHVEDIEEFRQNGLLAPYFADYGVDIEMLHRLQIRGAYQNWYYISPTLGVGEPVSERDAPMSLLARLHRISEQEHSELRRRALGPFTDGDPVMRGTLEYWQDDGPGSQFRKTNPFVAKVSFDGPRRGAPMPPSWTYNMKLRAEGCDYSVTKQISQTLKNGEADRFLLSLSADRSSFHQFRLNLVYNDDEILTSEPVSLELFVSTLDAYSMAKEGSEVEHISPTGVASRLSDDGTGRSCS